MSKSASIFSAIIIGLTLGAIGNWAVAQLNIQDNIDLQGKYKITNYPTSTSGGFGKQTLVPKQWVENNAGGTSYWTYASSNIYPTSTSYNVGIGNTSPSSALDVSGTVTANSLAAPLSAGNVSAGAFGSNTGG